MIDGNVIEHDVHVLYSVHVSDVLFSAIFECVAVYVAVRSFEKIAYTVVFHVIVIDSSTPVADASVFHHKWVHHSFVATKSPVFNAITVPLSTAHVAADVVPLLPLTAKVSCTEVEV